MVPKEPSRTALGAAAHRAAHQNTGRRPDFQRSPRRPHHWERRHCHRARSRRGPVQTTHASLHRHSNPLRQPLYLRLSKPIRQSPAHFRSGSPRNAGVKASAARGCGDLDSVRLSFAGISNTRPWPKASPPPDSISRSPPSSPGSASSPISPSQPSGPCSNTSPVCPIRPRRRYAPRTSG